MPKSLRRSLDNEGFLPNSRTWSSDSELQRASDCICRRIEVFMVWSSYRCNYTANRLAERSFCKLQTVLPLTSVRSFLISMDSSSHCWVYWSFCRFRFSTIWTRCKCRCSTSSFWRSILLKLFGGRKELLSKNKFRKNDCLFNGWLGKKPLVSLLFPQAYANIVDCVGKELWDNHCSFQLNSIQKLVNFRF